MFHVLHPVFHVISHRYTPTFCSSTPYIPISHIPCPMFYILRISHCISHYLYVVFPQCTSHILNSIQYSTFHTLFFLFLFLILSSINPLSPTFPYSRPYIPQCASHISNSIQYSTFHIMFSESKERISSKIFAEKDLWATARFAVPQNELCGPQIFERKSTENLRKLKIFNLRKSVNFVDHKCSTKFPR